MLSIKEVRRHLFKSGVHILEWMLRDRQNCPLCRQFQTSSSATKKGGLFLNPDSQASLQLQLQDFATEAFTEKFPDLSQSIHISAETLFSLLERAETKARIVKLGKD